MTAENNGVALGRYVYAVGVMALAIAALAFSNFDPGQPVPKDVPDRLALAYAAAAFMLIASAAILWRRTAAWGAAALSAYFAIVVVGVMQGRLMPAHYAEFGTYSNAAGQLAVAAGGLIVFAATAKIDAALSARLKRFGQLVFGLCAVFFGGAHFFYMNMTAPLVPTWLPPSQEFWGYATGVFHIAAGVAIFTGVQARVAAILLTVMYASFTPLVHVPMLLANTASHFIWSENAINIALTGVAWIVADSLAQVRIRSNVG